ncbi:hypothetical protein GE061_002649 [Apolygus lucorum]|uniref:Peptidase S1 domain-containing protein n=1 Tax=Apolygus lucorum TaxID=248454 RepID=A0A8S9X7I0_APOLU|nr:hypothetical protein GE061_002649 [Apolygus lucorum]
MIVFLVLLYGVGCESQRSTSSSTPQTYYQDTTNYFDEPELDNRPRRKPEKEWNVNEPGAEFTINLMAGRLQFPWLVHIQLEDTREEKWSVGNLITSEHVVTTCRAVATFTTVEKRARYWHEPNVTLMPVTAFRVLFCAIYIRDWHLTVLDKTRKYILHGDEDSEGEASGFRRVKDVVIHEGCTPYRLDHDLGVLILQYIIFPDKSWINWAPWAYIYAFHKNKKFDFSLSETLGKRKVCYVASFGGTYQNLQSNYARGYKVKYRAYYADWNLCADDSALICNTSYIGCWKDFIHYLDDPANRKVTEIQCFTTRAKVGSVCDHDRGAPLVCGGKIFGLVVRGALWDYCNDLYPLPFIVQLISNLPFIL